MAEINTKPIRVKTSEKTKNIPDPMIWVYRCEETGQGEYLKGLVSDIKEKFGSDSKYFLDNPVVYIHAWTTREHHKDDRTGKETSFIVDKIYIGEAENVWTRQNQHWDSAKKAIDENKKEKEEWQLGLANDFMPENPQKRVVPTLYVIACNLFSKSMTLEIEDRLINFAMAMNSSGKNPLTRVMNGRYNPQREYFGFKFANDIFRTIWGELVRLDPKFFPAEEVIQKSVIYKMSPHHRLNEEQKDISSFIKERCAAISRDSSKNDEPQLIMIEGSAGTGKSVLAVITLFELIHDTEGTKDIKMIINHSEQQKVFEDIVKKRGLGKDVVCKASTFIHGYNAFGEKDSNKKNPADIVFIDEAHLVYTNRTQGYEKKYDSNQINEIMKRSKITVILFDEFQALKKDQYLGEEYVKNLRRKSNGNRALVKQFRMNCSDDQLAWINNITGVGKDYTRIKGKICPIPKSGKEGYEIKIFKSPKSMYEAIKSKAAADTFRKEQEKNGINTNKGLSRMLATYDWHYSDELPEEDGEMWKVKLDDGFSMPWNYQYEKYIKALETKRNKRTIEAVKDEIIRAKINNIVANSSYEHMDNVWKLPWQEQSHTIDEIGSTYTIQGFDLEYAGVILGPSVRYDKETKEIYFDTKEKKDKHKKGWDDMTGKRSGCNDIGTVLLENEVRVLLTRGTRGLYIYAVDPDLREALLEAQGK